MLKQSTVHRSIPSSVMVRSWQGRLTDKKSNMGMVLWHHNRVEFHLSSGFGGLEAILLERV